MSKIAEELTPEELKYVRDGLVDHVNKEYEAGRVVGAAPGEKSPFVKKPLPRWARIAKAGGQYALGYSVGHAAGMVIDKGVTELMKRYGAPLSPYKLKILHPLLGLSTVGVMAAQEAARHYHQKQIEEGHE